MEIIELTKEDDICFSNCVGLGKIVSVGDGSDDFSAVSEGFIAITCLDTEPSWNNGDFSEKAETFVV